MNNLLGALLYVLPKNWLSHITGIFLHVKLPKPLSVWSMRWFAKRYQINLDEAEKPIAEYKSIGDLFVRKLKSGVRPISDSHIIHPADSVISQSQEIKANQLIQAKGRNFSVSEFIGDDQLAKSLEGGWSATYYLCPTDYHRVHTPLSGEVLSVWVRPGKLWPVNEWSVGSIDQLFSVNERVVVHMKTDNGHAVVVLVGATNVGKMELSFLPKVKTNIPWRKEPHYAELGTDPIFLNKGEELGLFRMGSTVVVLYQQELVGDTARPKTGSVQMGQPWSPTEA